MVRVVPASQRGQSGPAWCFWPPEPSEEAEGIAPCSTHTRTHTVSHYADWSIKNQRHLTLQEQNFELNEFCVVLGACVAGMLHAGLGTPHQNQLHVFRQSFSLLELCT